MTAAEWRKALGELVRASAQSPEYARFYSIRLTKARAGIYITQLGLYIRHRRDCWMFVSGNCPDMAVKQDILGHEWEEMVQDEYSDIGHLILVVEQAKAVGLSAEDVLNAQPLPLTRAALYAYGWLTRHRPWQEGLAALMVTEMANDNRLLEDLGGGLSLRTGRKWVEDLGLSWEQVPNSRVHAQADEKHGELFLPALEAHVAEGQVGAVLEAARQSLELRELTYRGISEAMEALPGA
ncbi:MAG: iron-containing redox enzyme family protein [Deltaproteobacteria bacterium]|nr:iron-containing redox enzyme family protein [Deltaproteobacteria bacterium]